MARLPIPGSDDGTWGGILNDFLGVEHNPDGSQKTLPIAKGGTGATDASTALTNLGAVPGTDSRLSDARPPAPSTGDLVFASDSDASGEGDIIFATQTVEEMRITRPIANVSQLLFNDPSGVHGPFAVTLSRADSFASTIDPVMYLGYNIGRDDGPIMAGEPVSGLNFEADYNDGAYHNLETYFTMWDKTHTYNVRPIMIKGNRDAASAAGLILGFAINAPTIDITVPGDAAKWLLIDGTSNSIVITGRAGHDTTLGIDAPASYAPNFRLSQTGGKQLLMRLAGGSKTDVQIGNDGGATAPDSMSIGPRSYSDLTGIYLKNVTGTPAGTNIGLGNNSFGSRVGVIAIGNAATAPTANPSGGGLLYVTAGALFYRGSSGTITQLALA